MSRNQKVRSQIHTLVESRPASAVRKAIYTTNAAGTVNFSFRKVTKRFFLQLDFLMKDWNSVVETIEQQKQDIQKLMALFIERDIPIPGNIIDRYNRYIRCDTDIDSDEVDELPLD